VPILRTSDGKDVEWPWPTDVKTISLSAKRLAALRSRSAVVRIIGHADLYDFQIGRLYPHPTRRDRAVRMRKIAKRIIHHKMEDLCVGIGEVRIMEIFYSTDDPSVLRHKLMNAPYNERRALDDIEALKEMTC
jgi:hypothetical protein